MNFFTHFDCVHTCPMLQLFPPTVMDKVVPAYTNKYLTLEAKYKKMVYLTLDSIIGRIFPFIFDFLIGKNLLECVKKDKGWPFNHYSYLFCTVIPVRVDVLHQGQCNRFYYLFIFVLLYQRLDGNGWLRHTKAEMSEI